MTTFVPMASLWGNVRFFSPHEFGRWANQMEPALIFLVDKVREMHGQPWRILDAGRDTSENDQSEHLPHPDTGLIRALDTRPEGGPVSVYRAWVLADRLAVPGLGAYDGHGGNRQPFLHLDVGQGDRRPRPARWIRRDGVYTTWNVEETDGWPANLPEMVADLMGVPAETALRIRRQVSGLGVGRGLAGIGVGLGIAALLAMVYLARR